MVNLNTIPPKNGRDYYIALGLEGSANKLGVGIIVKHPLLPKHANSDLSYDCEAEMLSNIRDILHLLGILPRDTAKASQK
ncbi:CFC_HP_G0057290.mRNA.1.CDS.1 [Saccharomyces cerevisiae]|nr:CFC_HP_G0057290.mRNA.1.CDS.1 [Saccharomyces cerevisiae]CAI6541311.1 CFC_HP_G0057290.mRNA.1.CDS.1 [Saccharomyces cerevisiae]